MKKLTQNALMIFALFIGIAQAEPLNVCVTVPDLGDLAKVVGGDQVNVIVFVKGQEDPHSLVAKPSDVIKLSQADAFIFLGLEMEIGWAPALLDRARNNQIVPAKPGYIDASTVIKPIHDTSSSVITRAMGDLHPEGNPHYLLDPVNGLMVAKLLAEKFSILKPGSAKYFAQNFKKFESIWAEKAFGAELIARYPLDKLLKIQSIGKLGEWLEQTGESNLLKGWFGKMAPLRDRQFVADHSQWPYFSSRFQIKIERFLDPTPGNPPSARYLNELVAWMNAENILGVLSSTYYPPQNLAFIQKNCKAQLLPTAHQVGSRSNANSYLSMIDYNVDLIYSFCIKY